MENGGKRGKRGKTGGKRGLLACLGTFGPNSAILVQIGQEWVEFGRSGQGWEGSSEFGLVLDVSMNLGNDWQ